MKKYTIGIIGGNGGMGRFFDKIFRKYGHDVLVSSRRTVLTSKELALQSDVIFISTPVEAGLEIVKEIGPLLREDQLLSDFCSQKEAIVKCMVENTKAEVVGTHPMFGPTVQILKGQNVIMCPGRGTRWLEWLEEIFSGEEAVLTRMDGKQHDTFMAVTQGLTHLMSVALARTLQRLDINTDEAMKLATQVFRLKLDLIGRLFALDISLYNSLMGKNPYVPGVLDVFRESLEEAFSKASNPDSQICLDFLVDLRNFYGDFKDRALMETNEIFELMYSGEK